MNLLEKKSIAAKDVMDFMWSPRSNMISYWSPAVGNHPALINIISIPDRTNICSRKIVDVKEGRMVWQNDGEYLCVYVVKVTNKKKSTVLMLFRVNESGVPVEQTEISSEHVYQVAWEPSGDRFAVLQVRALVLSPPSFSFIYSLPSAFHFHLSTFVLYYLHVPLRISFYTGAMTNIRTESDNTDFCISDVRLLDISMQY